MNQSSPMVSFLCFIAFMILYFIPAMVGQDKVHKNGITTLNFFLGWTFIGWVAALIWAVSSPKESSAKAN